MNSSRRPSSWWRPTFLLSIPGRRERGFTSDERPGNTRPVDSCRGFAGVGVETPSNRLTDNQGMQVILTRFRLCCFSPSCSSHSTSSNTTRSASVPPPEAFSLLLPPSLTHSPCHAVLLPPPVQNRRLPRCKGALFDDSGSRTCAILSWNRCPESFGDAHEQPEASYACGTR